MKLPTKIQHFLALTMLMLAVSVCDDDETSSSPAVTVAIAGTHSLRVGESLALSASTTGASDSGYRWATSESDVATVDGSGQVTGVGAGEAMIIATGLDSGVLAEHVVVVTPLPVEPGAPVVMVTGTPFVAIGSTVELTASTVGGTDGSYTWTSSAEDIAAVAEDGTVLGLFAGEALITATGDDTGESGTLLVAISAEVPHYDEWLGSAHADHTAEAFVHWNAEDPAEIPTTCATCHSSTGYVDFIADNTVDNPAPVGTVVECGACHNQYADVLDEVTFPSGVVIDELGAEARCMVCHQGRSSSDDVDAAIATAAVTTDDEVSATLSFQNIHYYAAGATINAGRVRGGYQYASDDQLYDWRFRHVPGYDTCIGCHDPHTLEVKVSDCAGCHENISNKDDLKNVRMIASNNQDYDGDGNLTEGIYYEIDGLRGLVLAAIQAYTLDESLGAICYDEHAHPYWFIDTDADGSCSAAEATAANKFASWTARLLKAAYNYQVAKKDPGGFAHNGKYIIQLLFDSIANVNQALTTPIDMANAVRNDSGHFNGAGEAARHWDEEEEVSASCSKCHGGSEGLHFFVQYGVGQTVHETDNGLDCATCHTTFAPSTFDIIEINSVLYPSGITISDPGEISNVCAVCHSGRESMKTIDDRIATGPLGFRNVHYLPAAAVKKGKLAKVGYQFKVDSMYSAEWTTHGNCVDCHSPLNTNHSFQTADNTACTNGCHSGTPIHMLRTNHVLDYDNDGNATEPLADEIQGLADALLAQMQTTAAICYEGHVNPYWFRDNNPQNGVCDPAETTNANRFTAWTAAFMKAGHNYQISQKEPGAWAHNFDYMAQLLIDAIEHLGGNVSGYIRPAP